MTASDLDLPALRARLPDRLGRRVTAVDSHTAGESTRVLLGGIPEPRGCGSVAEARLWLMREHDPLRRFVTGEPRGHRDLVGAWITAPRAPEADFGVVFMDARRYPYACGTATVGSITTMVELGLVSPRGEDGVVVVDTPAGVIRARVEREAGRVESVALDMMPSCVLSESAPIELRGGERLQADLVFVGGVLAFLSSAELPLELVPERAGEIIALGEALLEAANAQREVRHPESGEETTVDGVVFYDPAGHRERRGYGAVVYGASHLDRSPCGTGTTAKMTLLYHRGELGLGESFENRGILGTAFEGRLLSEAQVGSHAGVLGSIRASAHLVGIQELFLDASDPFPDGFVLP